MKFYRAALLMGVIAGLRTMTPLAAVSWMARRGALGLGGTWLEFLGYTFTPRVLTAAALAELVADQSPRIPSRTAPAPFAGRIVSGALSGAALGTRAGSWVIGMGAGAIGATVGTLSGAALRRRGAAAFHEDAIAIAGAALTLGLVP
jgi:uncharacterized membrane protein